MLKQSFPVNLHTHTYRCRHATGNVPDYCREAVKQKMSVLGFSDHCPFPDGRYSTTRMEFSELDSYLADLDAARTQFPELTILSGLEIDYRAEYGTAYYQDEFLGRRNLDYLIGGVHFVPDGDNVPHWIGHGPFSFRILRKFVDHTLVLMETGLIDYLAHPDITGRDTERWTPDLKSAYREIIDAAVALDLPLEINANGIRKGFIRTPEGERYGYPWAPFWEMAAEAGVKAVIGSDAHSPEKVLGERKECLDFASHFGFVPCEAEVAARILQRKQSGL